MPAQKKSTRNKQKEKRFVCTGYEGCTMAFDRKEHLLRHQRKHTGERPFSCIISGCGKKFSREDNMRQHTRVHDKPVKGHEQETARSNSEPLFPFNGMDSGFCSRRTSDSSLTHKGYQTRRLSLVELETPLEEFKNFQHEESPYNGDSEDSIDVSSDEFDALQALGLLIFS